MSTRGIGEFFSDSTAAGSAIQPMTLCLSCLCLMFGANCSEDARKFSINAMDGLTGSSQVRFESWNNGTMSGMYAYPVGDQQWQLVNYEADDNGFRLTSSKKVNNAELLSNPLLKDPAQGKVNNIGNPGLSSNFIQKQPQQPQQQQDQDANKTTNKTVRNAPADTLLFTSKRYCGFSPKVSTTAGIAGQYPWSVAVLSSDNVFQCAGTLISESIVLTTASCILNYKKSNSPLKVVLGAYSLPVAPNTDPIIQLELFAKSAVINPLYKAEDSQDLRHNIGLLRLSSNVDFDLYPSIFPVCVIGPALEKQAGTSKCRALGWSNIRDSPRRTLSSADVQVSKSGCPDSVSSCVNGPACNANEGSEVICLANSQRYYQWGIVAGDVPCSGKNPSGPVPTVSVIENYEFISKYLWTANPNVVPA